MNCSAYKKKIVAKFFINGAQIAMGRKHDTSNFHLLKLVEGRSNYKIRPFQNEGNFTTIS